MSMSDAEIREALARAERATPGPWLHDDDRIVVPGTTRKGNGAPKRMKRRDVAVIAMEPNGACGDPECCDQGYHLHLGAADGAFIAHARADVPRLAADLLAARAERDEALELQRMRAAAISVACQCNTPTSAAEQRIGHDNPYWAIEYQDVCDAVDREMRERARAEAAEARVKELDGFVRSFLHSSSGTPDKDAAALLSRLETRAQVLLSPPSPHTCQLHRATSGASDCGLSPCEEAKVHRDRGALRPKMRCAICGLVEHVGRCASSPTPSPEAAPVEADTAPEAAKCATCGGTRRTFNDGTRIPGIGWSMSETKPCPTCAPHGPDCHGCGGGA